MKEIWWDAPGLALILLGVSVFFLSLLRGLLELGLRGIYRKYKV
jgi:hypothetical protein